MLRGNSDRAPVGTPSESNGRSLMSGSSDAEASARSSDSRYGWPLSGARLIGVGRFTAAKAISALGRQGWLRCVRADVGENFGNQILCCCPPQPSVRYRSQRVTGLGY